MSNTTFRRTFSLFTFERFAKMVVFITGVLLVASLTGCGGGSGGDGSVTPSGPESAGRATKESLYGMWGYELPDVDCTDYIQFNEDNSVLIQSGGQRITGSFSEYSPQLLAEYGVELGAGRIALSMSLTRTNGGFDCYGDDAVELTSFDLVIVVGDESFSIYDDSIQGEVVATFTRKNEFPLLDSKKYDFQIEGLDAIHYIGETIDFTLSATNLAGKQFSVHILNPPDNMTTNENRVIWETSRAALGLGEKEVYDETILLRLAIIDPDTGSITPNQLPVKEITFDLLSVTLNEPLPTSVPYAQEIAINLNMTDARGNKVRPHLLFGPRNMSLDSSGVLRWMAQPLMLSNEQTVLFGISRSGKPDALLMRAHLAVTDLLAARQPLVRSTHHTPTMAESGMIAADFDGDGKTELVVLSDERVLYTLEYNGQNYVQDWVLTTDFPLRGQHISVDLYDIDLDGLKDIIVTTERGVFFVSSATKRAQTLFRADLTGLGAISDIAMSDIGEDGSLDFFLLSNKSRQSSDIQVVHLSLGNHSDVRFGPRVTLARAATDIDIGNVDAEQSQELVIGSGYILDAKTLATEWDLGREFGYRIAVGDLTGNGIQEIISLDQLEENLSVFSVGTEQAVATATGYYCAFGTGDISADGIQEIIVGDCFGDERGLKAYRINGLLFEEVWRHSTVFDDPASMLLYDLDDDGSQELAWVSGVGTTRQNSIVIASIDAEPKIEWFSSARLAESGPIKALGFHDVSPGNRAAIFLAHNASIQRVEMGNQGGDILRTETNGYFLHVDESSGSVSLSEPLTNNSPSHEGLAFVKDINQDGFSEAVVVVHSNDNTRATENYALVQLDSASTRIFETIPGFQDRVSHQALIDFDVTQDGVLEVIIGKNLAVSASATTLEVFDPLNRVVISSVEVSSVKELAALQGSATGSSALFLAGNNQLSRFVPNGNGIVEDKIYAFNFPDSPCHRIIAGSLDHNGSKKRVFCAQRDGLRNDNLFVFDEQLNFIKTIDLDFEITDLALTPSSRSGRDKNLIIGATNVGDGSYRGVSKLFILDVATEAVILESPSLVGAVSPGSIFFDLESENPNRLQIGTDTSMIITQP